MRTEAPQRPQPSSLRKFLRISSLLGLGMVTAGSGWGNPGCGDGDTVEPARCESGCAIEGVYQTQFDDTSTLSSGCKDLGVTLPKGPLVLNFADTRIEAMLDGNKLSGLYFGEPGLNFVLTGSGDITEKTSYFLTLKADVSPAPQVSTTPVTLRGTLELTTFTSESSSPGCAYNRRYTATR